MEQRNVLLALSLESGAPKNYHAWCVLKVSFTIIKLNVAFALQIGPTSLRTTNAYNVQDKIYGILKLVNAIAAALPITGIKKKELAKAAHSTSTMTHWPRSASVAHRD